MAKEFMNYINGEWTGSSNGKMFEQRNPANLDEITGNWPASTSEDAASAIKAAGEAFEKWSTLTVYKRAEYLKNAIENMKKRRDEIAEVLTSENGKTLSESKAEIDSAIKEATFQISEGVRMCGQVHPVAHEGVFAYEIRRPLGVVSVILPWNFPFNVPARKCVPALIAGNTCVLKPASLTPQAGAKFVELFDDAAIPAGVINFVSGGGSTVGNEMISNPLIKAISFTGSTEVGCSIHRKAAEIMARTQLEMGGKNPVVVLDDADLDEAAESAVKAAFACAGQWCASTSRAIVIRSAASELTKRIVEKTREIVVGDGRDEKTTMGPVCGKDQAATITKYIEIGKQEGAKLEIGGNRLTKGDLANGCFIEPTVFSHVKPDMTIAKEEIFGPVLSIIEVDDFDEALTVANGTGFGLTSSVYTKDLGKAMQFLEKIDTGLTHVNMMTAYKEPQFSFGGVKNSGHGVPEAGQSGIQFFTEHKVAYIKYR
ncbi:MAG: aldehyde dehydrogenase family protein [Chitinivibrionales bacterium]|nr:aldehyde dehydrogenase family protein [Chitinivibrionales bacterium]